MAKMIDGLCIEDCVSREDWVVALQRLKEDSPGPGSFQHGVMIAGKCYSAKHFRLVLANLVRARLGRRLVSVGEFTGGRESCAVVLACRARCRRDGDGPVTIGQVAPLVRRPKLRKGADERS